MKRTLALLGCLLGFTITLFGQGSLTTINPNAAAPGYSGSLTITGTGTRFDRATAGINLKLTHTGNGQIYNFGTAPGGAGWQVGYIGMPMLTATGNITLPGNAPIGQYNVELTGYSGDNYLQNMYVSAPAFFTIAPAIGTYSGKLISDLDSNCVQNGGDYGIPGRLITANPGNYVGVTDASGVFSMVLPMGTYTFSTPAPNGTLFVCPASPFTRTGTVNVSGGTATGLDFYVKTDHITDVSTTIQIGPHRPGFTNNYVNFTITNNTPTPANNVVAKLVKPASFTWTSFQSGTPTVVADTATFSVGTLPPFTSVMHTARLGVPIGTLIGTPYTYSSSSTTSSTENVTANNGEIISGAVTGSYDPNDKQVWTANGQIANGFIEPTDSLLRYLIRFQNTGTDTAFNITIRDTFDANLNMSSLTIVGHSHPVTLQIPDSTGRRVRFVFSNIMLADSFVNEPLSHGWIEYTVKRKSGLTNGTVISNRASIYFDFNSPVLTNAVNSTICPSLGTAFTFTTNNLAVQLHGPTTGSANTWSWNFGDGQTGTGANPTHTYAAGGTYNVCVTVGNACGRTKQICANVTVTCAPLNAGFTNSQGSGYTMNFTNTSTGAPTSVLWNFGNGATSTQTNPVYTYPAPGTYNVCLYLTNACAQHDTICHTVTVVCPPMNAGFTNAPSGLTVAFTNSSTGTYTSLLWQFGDGGVAAVANPSHTYTQPGLYTVCLILTNACGTQDTTCSNIAVGCSSVPVSNFSSTMALNVATFTDLSSGTNVTYLWDFGDGNTSTVASPVHTYNTAGAFNVCLTVTDACATSATHCGVVNVTCVPPTSAFTAAVNGSAVTFTDQSINGPTSWHWDFGDGATSAFQNTVHNYAAVGTYNACLTTQNGCSTSVYCENVVVTVMTSVATGQLGDIVLLPNPAQDHVQLRMTQTQVESAEFKLSDALGRVVYQWDASQIQGDYVRDIDLGTYAKGIYFLHITSEGANATLRLLRN